jgi:hypothetical protein
VIVIGPFVVLFAADGAYLGWHTATEAFPGTRAAGGWQAAHGFKKRPISVERFRVPDRGIFIEDLTWTHGEFLANPDDSQFSDVERADFPSEIARWVEGGMFVFTAGGDDYWVDADGAVE